MANIQVNQIQMPQLREIAKADQVKPEKSFKFTLLSQIEDVDLQERFKDMLQSITDQGNKIAEHMDIRDVKLYRSMISEFLNEVVSRSHKFSRESFLDKRGRHRVYGVIRQVNLQIDELARNLIQEEKKQIDILGKVGEIQGLLLDLLT